MPELICPITLDSMKIPVLTNSGLTYEFTAIAKYLLTASTALAPTSQEKIVMLTLNRALRSDVLVLSATDRKKAAQAYLM